MATNVKQEHVKREPGQTVLPWPCLHAIVAKAEGKQPPAIDLDSTPPRPTRAGPLALPPQQDQPIRTPTLDSPRSRSPKREVDGGAGKFTSAKARQDSFQSKMRSNKCPIELKEKWAELSKLDRFNPLRQSFVDEIARINGFDFSGVSYVRTSKAVSKETATIVTEGMCSYSKFCDIHGKVNADEFIRLKLCEMEPDPSLVEGHRVPWPDDHLFAWSESISRRKKAVRDSADMSAEVECDDDMKDGFNVMFDLESDDIDKKPISGQKEPTQRLQARSSVNGQHGPTADNEKKRRTTRRQRPH